MAWNVKWLFHDHIKKYLIFSVTGFSFQNNHRNLNPSYKLDLVDSWDFFIKVDPILWQAFVRLIKIFGIIPEREKTRFYNWKYTVKWMDTPYVSAIFSKGDNFQDFVSASMQARTVVQGTRKDVNCYKEEFALSGTLSFL